MDHVQALVWVAAPVAVCATLLRYALNHYIAGCHLGERAAHGNKRAIILEESWLLVSSTILLGLSTWVSEHHNASCGLFDQSGCFDNWPEQKDSPQMTIVLATFIGWYVHGVAKSLIPGVALRSGVDMLGHHVLTLSLFVVGHLFGVLRMGFLILALLNFSNPFMHSAKLLNYLHLPRNVTTPAFCAFGASFALSRCAIFPALLAASWREMRAFLAAGDRRVVLPAIVCFSGMGALQLLQFYWLARIVRVLMRGSADPRSKSKVAQAEEEADEERRSPREVSPGHDADANRLRADANSPRRPSDASTSSVTHAAASDDELLPQAQGAHAGSKGELRQRAFFDSAREDDQVAARATA